MTPIVVKTKPLVMVNMPQPVMPTSVLLMLSIKIMKFNSVSHGRFPFITTSDIQLTFFFRSSAAEETLEALHVIVKKMIFANTNIESCSAAKNGRLPMCLSVMKEPNE